MIKEHKKYINSPEVVEVISENREMTIAYCADQIQLLETKAQGGCKARWDSMGKQPRDKDPFNYLT